LEEDLHHGKTHFNHLHQHQGKKKRGKIINHNKIAVEVMVKMVNLPCTSSDAGKQPRQRESIHGSQPSGTIKFKHYQQ
jgi:hypothetical protein